MIEIRIHGRGGQGVVTASDLLAVAAFKDGKYSQAFPFFGTERTGAPIATFCRIDSKPIRLREYVYEPNYVIVLDPTLMGDVDVAKGLKKGGIVIVNSGLHKNIKNAKFIDVTKIALEVIGKPFANVAILGAFSAATGVVSLKNLVDAVNERFAGKIAELNVKALKRAYEEMKK
jgi:pyruvate ferredoxin oxidoreductase gamma subunit